MGNWQQAISKVEFCQLSIAYCQLNIDSRVSSVLSFRFRNFSRAVGLGKVFVFRGAMFVKLSNHLQTLHLQHNKFIIDLNQAYLGSD